jgi:amidase
VETAVAHEATYPARSGEYGSALAGLIDVGHALSGLDYQKIILRRNDFRGRVAALFETIDLLLVPAQGFAAPTTAMMATVGGDEALMSGLLRYTCPFDMTGSPTITLPCGVTAAGLPIAFQLVSRHMEEALLVRAGIAFQAETDWHRRHPPIA